MRFTPQLAALLAVRGAALNQTLRGRDIAAQIRALLFGSGEVGAMYDPSDLSTLYQDSAGTTPVTAVGQVVGLMLDKSGNGFNATQATLANKPVLQQDGNGMYYLAFDGIDDFLVTPSIDFSATDKMGVFSGVRCASNSGMLVELSSNSDVSGGFYIFSGSIGKTKFQLTDAGAVAAAHERSLAAAYPLTEVWAAAYNYAGAARAEEVSARINGSSSLLAEATGTAVSGSFTNSPIYIGRRGGTSLPFNGNLYQLIVRGALPDAAQITAAESYVNSKTRAY